MIAEKVQLNDAVIYELAKLMSGPTGAMPFLLDLRIALGLNPSTPVKPGPSHNGCVAAIRKSVYGV